CDGDIEWQPRAAANAAAFAVRLAEEISTEQEETAMAANASEPPTTGVTVHNTASGQVGIQAANVSGSTVWMGAPPPEHGIDDLVAAVADLRARLDRDRASGEVDDDTYEAARDELDSAETALRAPGDRNRRKALLALKRLSGLAADTTSLGAKIALVIAAAGSLS